MNIGKARALFEQVASGEYHGSTVGEYLEAVKIVLDMETHNSISKKMIISVCKWLVEIAEKAVTPYRWIPVSERAPEDYVDVLVWFEYFRYGNYNRMYATHGIGNYSKEYNSWAINHETGWKYLHVFAWMPLPEPFSKMETTTDGERRNDD